MKKFRIYFSLILALAICSCAKEKATPQDPIKKTHVVSFVAGNPEGKTTVSTQEIEGVSRAVFAWDATGETFKVLQEQIISGETYTVVTAAAENVTLDDNTKKISFSATLEDEGADSYNYLVIYPEWAYSAAKDFSEIELSLKNPQYPSTTSYDPEADMMASAVTPSTGGITSSEPLSLAFLRLVTVVKMNIKDLAIEGSETVQSVSINFEGKEINGDWSYDPAKEQLTIVGDGKINVIYDTENPGKTLTSDDKMFDVWFTCAPFSLEKGDCYTITVATDKATYTKTATKTSDSSMRFGRGNLSTISANFSGVTRTAITKSEQWNYTFVSSVWDAKNFVPTQSLNGKSWTLDMADRTYINYDGTKGVQLGSKTSSCSYITLTSNFGATAGISRVSISASGASGICGTVSVSVGGHILSSESTDLTSTNTSYVFESSTLLTGDVVIRYDQTSSCALYLKTISINKEPQVSPITAEANKTKISINGTATITVGNQLDRTITYSSSNDEIASVNESGVITGIAEGEATITVNAAGNADYAPSSVDINITVENTGVQYNWTKVTDASSLVVGDIIVIAAANYNYAMSTTQNSNNRGQATISKQEDGTYLDDVSNQVQQITLVEGNKSNTFALKVGNNQYLYAASSSANQLKTQSEIDDNGSWIISITGGFATICAQGTNSRKNINHNNGSSLFSCYSSSDKNLYIYKFNDGKSDNDLSASNQTINTGVQLDLSTAVTGGNGQPISYSVSPTQGATITDGVFSATIPNTYTVTASQAASSTVKAKSINFTVTVNKVAVTGVTLNETSKTVNVGENFTLTATVAPDNATYKGVSWSSSNEAVATVSDAGVVTAVKEGTATITVSSNDDNSKTATCSVIVNKIEVTGVTLNETSKTVNVGENFTLIATVAPDNATYKGVSWSSSNEAVATVSGAGVVTAVKEGTATITVASNDDNSKTATCSVTVNKIAVTSVTLSASSKTLTVGENFTLTATVNPDNATYKSVSWSSSNEAVATVSGAGVVTAVKEGTATITVTSSDDNTKTATCSVTVNKIVVTGVTLSASSKTLTVGENFTLTATVAPDNATYKGVSWSSSNEAVATVSNNGIVTAVKEGAATITVTSNDDNSKTATCSVTVSATSSWTRCTKVSDLTAGGTFIIGYEATAKSGTIVPMQNSGTATTSAAGLMYSGTSKGSTGDGTITMSSVTETSKYEVTIAASTSVDGAIVIKVGNNYIGNTNTKNNLKLFTSEATTTAFTPTVSTNDVFTLKINANSSYHTLQYNSTSPRFAVYGGAQKNLVIYKKN